jgi:iron complex transport system substrate-binding protein
LSIGSKKIVSVTKPSVLIIEWLEPLMIAGHWVPEMVERAGGQMLVAKQKEPSQYVSWEDIVRLDPDIIIIAPCGFDIKRTVDEIGLITNKKGFKNLKAVKNKQVFLVDGNAYLTRPGPRIVDGVEILAEIFHPHLFFRKYPASSWQTMSIYY